MQLEQKYLTLIKLVDKNNTAHANKIATCLQILSTANAIDAACANKLADYHLSESRFLILSLLMHHQQLTSLEIAALMGVAKPSVTSLIQGLLLDELIIKTSDMNDKRKAIITLTAKGDQIIHTLFKNHTQWIERMTHNFTQEESQQLTHLLNKLLENIQE